MAISNSQLLNNQSQYVKLTSGKVQNICCQPFELKKKIAEIEKGIPFEDLLIFQTEANQTTSNSQAFQNLWYVVDSKKQNQENQLLKKNLLAYEEQLKVAQNQLNNLETQLQEALEQNQQLIDNNQKQKNLSEASFKEQFDQQQQNFQDQIKSLQQNESAKINQLVKQNRKEVEGLTLQLNQITTQFNESQRIKGEQEKLIATLQTDLATTISMNQDWEKSYQEVVKKNKENEEYLQKYYEQTYQQQLQTIQLCLQSLISGKYTINVILNTIRIPQKFKNNQLVSFKKKRIYNRSIITQGKRILSQSSKQKDYQMIKVYLLRKQNKSKED